MSQLREPRIDELLRRRCLTTWRFAEESVRFWRGKGSAGGGVPRRHSRACPPSARPPPRRHSRSRRRSAAARSLDVCARVERFRRPGASSRDASPSDARSRARRANLVRGRVDEQPSDRLRGGDSSGTERGAKARRRAIRQEDLAMCEVLTPGPASPLFQMDISMPTVLTADLSSVMDPPMCQLAPKKTHIIRTLGPSSPERGGPRGSVTGGHVRRAVHLLPRHARVPRGVPRELARGVRERGQDVRRAVGHEGPRDPHRHVPETASRWSSSAGTW